MSEQHQSLQETSPITDKASDGDVWCPLDDPVLSILISEKLETEKFYELKKLVRDCVDEDDFASLTNLISQIPRSFFYDGTVRKPRGHWDTLLKILMDISRWSSDHRPNPKEHREFANRARAADHYLLHPWKRHELTKDVIFLDIDGVLQGDWTWPAYGFYYGNCHRFLWDPKTVVKRLDQHFLSFLQGLCREKNVSVVLCSTWRNILRDGYLDMFAHYLDIPIAGATGNHGPEREDEVLDFITQNPIVRTTATLDDELYDVGARLLKNPSSDREGYLVENTHFRIDNIEGPRVSQMRAIAQIFGTTFDDVCRSNRIFRKDREE